MNPQVFKNHIELCHKVWLGERLGLFWSCKRKGIDLYDQNVGIELKCRLKTYSHRYTIHEYQIEQFEKENAGKALFWAFMLYTLTKDVEEIRKNSRLERLVLFREIWFLEWDWAKKFPVHKTERESYRYPGNKDFPPQEEFKRIDAEKGILYVPKRSFL